MNDLLFGFEVHRQRTGRIVGFRTEEECPNKRNYKIQRLLDQPHLFLAIVQSGIIMRVKSMAVDVDIYGVAEIIPELSSI